jgi:hypothetical protein
MVPRKERYAFRLPCEMEFSKKGCRWKKVFSRSKKICKLDREKYARYVNKDGGKSCTLNG